MGDKEIRETARLLQILQQIDDLGLDGDIKGGDRFVRNDDPGFHSQGAGNPDTLALPPAEFVGKKVCMMGGKTHSLKQIPDSFPLLSSPRQAVNGHGFAQDGSDGHSGIEGGKRVLENHLNFSAIGEEGFSLQKGKVRGVLIKYGAFCGFQEPDYQAAECGFAASAFPHKSQCLLLREGEGHPIHCLEQGRGAGFPWSDILEDADQEILSGLPGCEIFFQVHNFQKGMIMCLIIRRYILEKTLVFFFSHGIDHFHYQSKANFKTWSIVLAK